jgi:NAD+ synthase
METTGKLGADLLLNTETVRTLLVEFLRDEAMKAGFHNAVLGMSGGVDSAVVAFLAAEAFGPEHVRAVLMPYRTSDPQSKTHAEEAAAKAGISTEVVDITPMVEPAVTSLKIDDRLRAGNVMARERMIVLYDISAREQALVLGTSNKTELLLGYGTMFGDLASAINPLGDLYKTQVWQLARALGVPRAIVEKKPSADLWDGQTDEQELGFAYNDVDRLLFQMIDQRRTDGELVGMDFDAPFVEKVRTTIRRTQFKRRLPVIAKVSTRTINVDFRYPRDWGI